MIKLEHFVVSDFGVNSFVLYDETAECVIIDPGFYSRNEREKLTDFIAENNLTPVKVLNTHCHVDHVFGNRFIITTYNIPLLANKADEFLLSNLSSFANIFGLSAEQSPGIDQYINDGDPVAFGKSSLLVIHVPGHSPGSLAFYNKEGNFLIAGDTLFKGSIGRTDLPGGDYDTLISNIRNKLLSLPPETVVYPGHGSSTSIKDEHDTNPFLK